MKTCTKCSTERPLDEFPNDRSRTDGKFPWCRPCKRGGDAADHAKHREERNAKMRDWYARNREDVKAQRRARYAANPTYDIARAKVWAAANPEKRVEVRRASQARRWAADPERFREAWRKRKAAEKRGCEVFEFGADQVRQKIAYWGGRCWMCGAPAACLDHVKPLAAKGPHMLANLRPACTPCNARKRDVWPFTPDALRANKTAAR